MRILIVYTIIIFCLLGCRSKKKTVERSSSDIKLEAVTEFEQSKEVAETKDSVSSTGSQTISVARDQVINVKSDSPEREINITEQETPSGRSITITGATEVTISDSDKRESKRDTAQVSVTQEVIRREESEGSTSVELDQEESSRNTDSDAQGLSVGATIGMALAVLILVLLLARHIYKKVKPPLIG